MDSELNKQSSSGNVSQNANPDLYERTFPTSLHVPESIKKRIKNLATARFVSAQSLWLEAIVEYLDRQSEGI